MLTLTERFSALFGLHLAPMLFGVAENPPMRPKESMYSKHPQSPTAPGRLCRDKKIMLMDEVFDELFLSCRNATAAEPQVIIIGKPAFFGKRNVPRRLSGDGKDYQNPNPPVFHRRQHCEVYRIYSGTSAQ